MTTFLTVLTHILTLLIIIGVARGIYKQGSGILLPVIVTLFLLVFGTVSVVESGIAAAGDATTKLILFVFVIIEAALVGISFSPS